MYCSSCACKLPAVARFCVRCGASTGFIPVAPTEGPRISNPKPPDQAVGSDYPSEHAYCERCGTKAVEGNRFCTTCGGPLRADNVPAQTPTLAHSIPSDTEVANSLIDDQVGVPANQPSLARPKYEKRPVLSREAWIVCSILSLLAAFNNAAKSGATGSGEFIPFAIGGFIGGLILFAGGWAIIVLISRWLAGWFSRMRHNHPNSHSVNQQPHQVSLPSVKRPRLRAYWLVPVAIVALFFVWAFAGKDSHFVTGPAAPAETVSHIRITGTLPNIVVLDGSNEAPDEKYRFEGRIYNDSRGEISFIRIRIRIFSCGATPQPEDSPLTQEELSRCTKVGESVREVYVHIGPGGTGDFGNFYFPERPQNYGWDYKILNAETPAGG